LDQLAGAEIAREEGLDMMRDIFREHMGDMEKEVQEILNDPSAIIPLEEKAEILYVPLAGAHTIIPSAVIFNYVGASWSLSMFEASNYAMFMGDIPRAKQIVNRILKEAERLNVKEIVLSECGHAYAALKWEAPKWFGEPFKFKVRSILEIIDDYMGSGVLSFDTAKNGETVTYHDPCNMGRKGGIFEEPRRIINSITSNYREMVPSCEQNFCCGGGGGLVANMDWQDFRIETGKVKADQIRETGANKVLTSCDNCLHQIQEISDHYSLNVEVSNVSQWAINSLNKT